MCDKKIQKEEKFFYEPGGPEIDLYIKGDEDCIGCPHRIVPYDYISSSTSNPSETEYECRGLAIIPGRSIELRMNGRT